MKKQDVLTHYCAGCGLCHSAVNADHTEENGFFRPVIESREINAFCEKICPAGGSHIEKLNPDNPWGDYLSYHCTWSKDAKVRHTASSGGTITAILCYLLENHVVDAVIHVGRSKENVVATEVSISESADEVYQKMGSRYAASSPLIRFLQMIDANKKYAFVGKPCAIVALNNYLERNQEIKKSIILKISFFCAGVPSKSANERLLKRMGTNSDDCIRLDYRGNGWPGFATAINKKGTPVQITYDEFWGEILGREVNRFCKFCVDGVGSFADIACGDAWYKTSDNKPDFTEHEGRNITFARTEIGQDVINKCLANGYLVEMEYDINELQYVQQHQFSRRTQVYNRIMGLKLCHRDYPYFNLKELREFSMKLPVSARLRITLGTMKRILTGKM